MIEPKAFLRYKKLLDKKKSLERELSELKAELFQTFDEANTSRFVFGKYDFVRQERVAIKLADFDTVEEVLSEYGIQDNFKKVVFDEEKLEEALRNKELPDSIIEKLAVKNKTFVLTIRPKKVEDQDTEASSLDL